MRPHPIFLALIGAFGAFGVLLWQQGATTTGASRALALAFVLTGWVVSLCLHEFGHAAVAFQGGDRAVALKGYLTLNPLRYTDPFWSLVVPLAFLVAGGIGFPGGAVYVTVSAIRSRNMRSAMSLAGPTANLVVALLIGLPFAAGALAGAVLVEHLAFSSALAFLAFMQIYAAVLNLLPIPGLDGYGAIEPYLPETVRAALAPLRQYSFIILFLLVFQVDALRDSLFRVAAAGLDRLSVPRVLFDIGANMVVLG